MCACVVFPVVMGGERACKKVPFRRIESFFAFVRSFLMVYKQNL